MDRGTWQATVHRVAKESDTTQRLNDNVCITDLLCYTPEMKQHCKSTILQHKCFKQRMSGLSIH